METLFHIQALEFVESMTM